MLSQGQRALLPTATGGHKEYLPSAAIAKRLPSKWPRPVWHPPWRNYRVLSGHLGCVYGVISMQVTRSDTCHSPAHTWLGALYLLALPLQSAFPASGRGLCGTHHGATIASCLATLGVFLGLSQRTNSTCRHLPLACTCLTGDLCCPSAAAV